MAPDGTGICFRIWRSRAATRSRPRSATPSRWTTGSATASRARAGAPPDPQPAFRSAAPNGGAGIASWRSAPGSSARRDTRASTSARRRACTCAGATASAASSSSAWRGTNDGRGPNGFRLVAAMAPAAAAGDDPCATPADDRSSRSALRRAARRAGPGRTVDRPPGGARSARGATGGDAGGVLADRRDDRLPRIPSRRRLGPRAADDRRRSRRRPPRAAVLDQLPADRGRALLLPALARSGERDHDAVSDGGARGDARPDRRAWPRLVGSCRCSRPGICATIACSRAWVRTPTRSWRPLDRGARATDSKASAPTALVAAPALAADRAARGGLDQRDYRRTDVTAVLR